MSAVFSWAPVQSIASLEQSRALRFRPEWRPLLLSYFGLVPGMRVLEVASGPGTLAPYFAAGIAPGTVVGLDLDPEFVAWARRQAERSGARGVEYVVGDAYALPFPAESFDAVLSYTGIGVLSDPESALREMWRVCRAEGVIAVSEAVTGPFGIEFGGLDSIPGRAEAFEGAARYWELRVRVMTTRPHGRFGSTAWPTPALFGLLASMGLGDWRLNAWGYAEAPDDDSRHEGRAAYRHLAASAEVQQWHQARVDNLVGAALSPEEWDDLERLTAARGRWLAEARTFDWAAGLSVVASGRKPDGGHARRLGTTGPAVPPPRDRRDVLL